MSIIKGAHELWYKQSAMAWEEALPVGNGRLGGMVFGDPVAERIGLNEDSLWSGYPRDTNAWGAAEYYPRAKELALAGRYNEAQELVENHMEGNYTQSYMPLGDLFIEFLDQGEIGGYRRSLDMGSGIASTRFARGSAEITSACFVSKPDEALIYSIKSDKPGAVNLRISMQSQLRGEVASEGGLITLQGLCPSYVAPSYLRSISDDEAVLYHDDDARRGMRFFCAALIETDGVISAAEGAVTVESAGEVIIKLCARTSFNGYDRHPYLDGIDERAACMADIDAIKGAAYADLLARHMADFAPLFDRVDFYLEKNEEDMPTDERLVRFIETQDDPALYELIFHYGRYLMLTASRSGTQATNLQGIWNKDLRPAWSSNYTVNINTEMNYWPAEPMAMGDMHGPLFDLIEKLTATGAISAKAFYGAEGSAVHHNTDIWGLANPVGENRKGTACHAFWPMSYGWLCRHMFEHYEYSLDKKFLKERALPAIEAACKFFLDIMVKNADGNYILTPATSPENSFTYEGKKCAVAESSAMSNLIMRECFENYVKSADILGIGGGIYDRVKEALPLIMPCEIGSRGQLLEWNGEFEEPEPHHRHVSHLYGLYPGDMTGVDNAPELANACKRSLEIRGDDGTGWSLGWKINLWARLRDGDRALRLLKRQLRLVPANEERGNMTGGGTYLNLFDAHPPFQIDGNFSACSGIGEMLLQCVGGKVLLLPALPESWGKGHMLGIRAKGGYAFDIYFNSGKLERAVVSAVVDNADEISVVVGDKISAVKLERGETVTING